MRDRKCPICGETDPLPASICLAVLTGDAERGKPCQYSVEGQGRTKTTLEEQSIRFTAAIEADRARRSALTPEIKEGRHG